jgi:hypothetical protein
MVLTDSNIKSGDDEKDKDNGKILPKLSEVIEIIQ